MLQFFILQNPTSRNTQPSPVLYWGSFTFKGAYLRNLIKHLAVAVILSIALLLNLVFNIFHGIYYFVAESEAVRNLVHDCQEIKTILQYSYNKGKTNAK